MVRRQLPLLLTSWPSSNDESSPRRGLIELETVVEEAAINGNTKNRPSGTSLPIFIVAVTLAELAFFTYYTAVASTGAPSSSGPLPIDSPFVYRPDRRSELWRFVLYWLIHAGWVHLMFNLSIQLLIGLQLEISHGSIRIAFLFTAGVLSGSLVTSVFDPNVYLVGASGGVYSILAAHLATVVVQYRHLEYGVVRIVAIFAVASLDVGFAVYDRYVGVVDASTSSVDSNILPSVSYMAHLAGATTGLAIGLLRSIESKSLWYGAVGSYASFLAIVIVLNLLKT